MSASRKLARQLASARRVADQLLHGVNGVLRVSVQTHADGTVTVTARVDPEAKP